jgi:transcription elongation factor Elf1
MDLVDSKYIGVISSRLQKFKKVKADLYNFRCPICGDSQKNKSKTRGYLYAVKADMNFRCHNCGASMTLSNFIKTIDPVIHKQYVFERFKGNKTGRGTVVEEPKFNFKTPQFKPKLDLPKASEVKIAKQYLDNRKLDSTKFYYTDKFKAWSNSHKKTFDSVTYDEPRIIIPLFYKNTLIGFQGRSLGPNKVKYITVMINDDAPKIYGLDNIRGDAPVFVTEGPFDSTFIRNSIAMCGSDGDVGKWGISDPVWVYDNEPRNREIVRRISDTIDRGDKVVIWPSNIEEKDINDMVLAGHSVQELLESNIYNGLKAKLQFNTWKRI